MCSSTSSHPAKNPVRHVENVPERAQIDPEQLSLVKGEGERLIFQIHAEQRTDLEVRLRPEGFDALASDNIAYIDLASSRVLSVHVHPNLSSFRLALRSIEGLRVLSQSQEKETPETDFDLVVSNREEELGLAAPVYLFVGVVPQT